MNSMQTIIAQFELQTKLFKNATTGYNETHAAKATGDANHVKWLTGHTVSSRYNMAQILGLNVAEPFPELFGNRKGKEDGANYPPMTDLLKDWDGVSEKLIAKLKEMKEEDYAKPAPFPHPMSDGTLKGLIGFYAHHEAYTLGQIAYARRIFGMEAMKYT